MSETRQASSTAAVLTYHNDISRTGLNSNEATLNTGTVGAATFGKLFSMPVDGKVYAQPLYVPSLAIGGGTHDVLIVATENDSVYAFDAVTGVQYWRRSLGTPVPSSDVYLPGRPQLVPTVGITGTPVVDTSTNPPTMYVVAATRSGTPPVWAQTIYRLNILTGVPIASQNITAQVSGDNGATITFDPRRANQRAGLLLVPGGQVYVAWGSHDDDAIDGNTYDATTCTYVSNGKPQVFYGWVMAFNAATLTRTAVFNAAPHANPQKPLMPNGGSIWQGGAGLASDGHYVYLNTGNGPYLPASKDYGDTLLKLDLSLSKSDSFTPFNYANLDAQDLDLASGGVVLLPPLANPVLAHPNLLVTTGKEGTIYLVDRDHLGGAQPSTGDVICPAGQQGTSCIVGRTPSTGGYGVTPSWVPAVGAASQVPDPGAFFGAPAYFNGRAYFGGNGDTIKAFSVGGSNAISSSPVFQTSTKFGYPGTVPTVSASSATDGTAVVWAVERVTSFSNPTCPPTAPTPVAGRLHAYSAMPLKAGTTTLQELYNSGSPGSRLSGTDDPDPAPQFTTPTVAGGRVYVAGTGYASGSAAITVYGLFSVARPVVSPSGGSFGASTAVTIADSTPGAKIYYTLNGTEPTPGAAGTLSYVSSFEVYSSVTVRARAFVGNEPSDVAVALLTGTCSNTYPSCGIDGAECSPCDDRTSACSKTGQCTCGPQGADNATVCGANSWCYTPGAAGFNYGCEFVPRSGSWFDPAKSGAGFSIGLSSSGALDLTWYTFTSGGAPIWYSGTLPRSGDSYSGPMMSYQWVNGAAVGTQVGTMSLATTSATAGTFSWRFTGQFTQQEPVQYLAFDPRVSTPPVTGEWYAPSQPGWHQFLDVQGSTVVAYFSFFDAQGNSSWVYGSASSTASGFTVPLLKVTGTNLCPSCTGTPSNVQVPAGTSSVRNINAADTAATLSLSVTSPAPTQWNTAALAISRRSQ